MGQLHKWQLPALSHRMSNSTTVSRARACIRVAGRKTMRHGDKQFEGHLQFTRRRSQKGVCCLCQGLGFPLRRSLSEDGRVDRAYYNAWGRQNLFLRTSGASQHFKGNLNRIFIFFSFIFLKY